MTCELFPLEPIEPAPAEPKRRRVPLIGPENWGPLLMGRLRRTGTLEGPLGFACPDVSIEQVRAYADAIEQRRAGRPLP